VEKEKKNNKEMARAFVMPYIYIQVEGVRLVAAVAGRERRREVWAFGPKQKGREILYIYLFISKPFSNPF
jgi:hypothetical protein